jgi:hypothetical protein
MSVFGALGALVFSGCAALEPEPCTSDWVKWQTDKITHDFRNIYGADIRELAKFSRQLENPSPLVLLQVTSRLSRFRDMAEDFSTDVMPELRGAIDQCGTPTKFVSAFSGLLAEQGVDQSVLDWVETTAVLIEENAP